MTNDTLRRKREALGLTQKEVAEAIPMSLNGYSFIERGLRAPSTKAWFRLKEILAMTDAEMVGAMTENAASVEEYRKEGRDDDGLSYPEDGEDRK